LHKKHQVFILHTTSSLQSANALFIFFEESTKLSSPSTGAELHRVVQLESMPGYKYPENRLGGYSHWERWPRTREIDNFEKHSRRRRNFEPMIDYKYLTIASGDIPIGSAGRAPDEELLR
jgi:hypothetical protein